MIVCLDISPAVHHRAGIGRYVQELTTALLAIDPENEYVAFYNHPAEAQVDPPLDRLRHLTTNLPDKPWRISVLLAQFARLSQDRIFPGIDLFHATDNLLPRLLRLKSVFTLYDLTFLIYPETHTSLNRWFLTLMMPHFLRDADTVIAISESSKQDAVRLYGLDEAKIRVIYGGVNSRFRPASPEAISAARQKYSLPKRFILYVGTIEPRKNLETLLEAFASSEFVINNWQLVIAGKRGWLCGPILGRVRELEIEERVVFTGYVLDVDLPTLYSAADLFIFPSLYEGFGLPPLEAMACGVPVVCSNTSSLPEVVGNAALTVDPYDIQQWIRAVRRALSDEQLKLEMREKGLERVKRFTWERTARETLEVYRRVLNVAREG